MNTIGIVPPPNSFIDDKYNKYISNTVAQINKLKPSHVYVYDIINEKCRSDKIKNRPFKFTERYDPRKFSIDLKKLIDPTIIITTFIALRKENAGTDNELINFIKEYPINNISLVGTSNIDNSHLSVNDACIALSKLNNLELNGITIPERHRDTRNEHFLIMERMKYGIKSFTTQIIYNVDNIILFLKDLAEIYNLESDINSEINIVLSFAPFGHQETADFLQWLGVEIPENVSRRILHSENSDKCIEESINICKTNLIQILNEINNIKYKKIKIGINVESVSKYKNKQAAADKLFIQLKHIMYMTN